MPNYDLVIVRPYATFPNEGAGVDRYITLHKHALAAGLNSLLLVSDFHHNKKKFRTHGSLGIENVELIEAGGYESNLSLKRLLYEVYFSYISYKKIKSVDTKSVLIGEPLFFGWVFFIWLKIRRNILVFGDFIDLMPEAYQIKFKNQFVFWLISWPLFISRWVRANYLYDRIFTVSQFYTDRILTNKQNNGGVFYWGCNPQIFNFEKTKSNVVAYVGSLGDGYDIETLVQLGRIRPDLKILIAGSGPKTGLCQDAHEEGAVEFLGQIGFEKLQEVYRRSTFGVLPYKKNSAVSMPIKFYEYLDNRLRIINSLKMECSCIISDNDLGRDYIAGDVFSMSDAINRASNIDINYDAIRKLVDTFSVDKQYKAFVIALNNFIQKSDVML